LHPEVGNSLAACNKVVPNQTNQERAVGVRQHTICKLKVWLEWEQYPLIVKLLLKFAQDGISHSEYFFEVIDKNSSRKKLTEHKLMERADKQRFFAWSAIFEKIHSSLKDVESGKSIKVIQETIAAELSDSVNGARKVP
jgi:hypothetical protein